MFFVIAKLAWSVLQPSMLLIVSAVLAVLAAWRGWTKAAGRLMAVSTAIGLAALSPLPNLLILPLEQRYQRAVLEGAPIRGVIVLGGSEVVDVAEARGAHALNEAAERITETVALSRLLPEVRIVLSGGAGQLFPKPSGEAGVTSGQVAVLSSEAAIMLRLLTDMGVSRSRLTLEDRSRDTYENATFSSRLIERQQGERWILVTSAFHMPRAMSTFRKAGFEVEPWPVDYRTRGWKDAGTTLTAADGLRRLDQVTREYIGLVVYWATGRSDALWP